MVQIIGSATGPSKEELLYDPKVRGSLSIGNSLQILKRRNPLMKVGFTNGCWRTLTPAHCVFLSLCRSRCDLLVVGMNSDYSLRLLGRESPFTDKERAFMLASLSIVDYVTVFDEETPSLCISNISPSFVFKGPDYKKEDVVSAPGIPVEIINHPFDVHASDILKSKSQNKFFKL